MIDNGEENRVAVALVREFSSEDSGLGSHEAVHFRLVQQCIDFFRIRNPPSGRAGVIGFVPIVPGGEVGVPSADVTCWGPPFFPVPLVEHAVRLGSMGKSPRRIHVTSRPAHSVNQHSRAGLCLLCDRQFQGDDAVAPRQGLDAMESVCPRHCPFLKSRIAEIVWQILGADGHGSVSFDVFTFPFPPIGDTTDW